MEQQEANDNKITNNINTKTENDMIMTSTQIPLTTTRDTRKTHHKCTLDGTQVQMGLSHGRETQTTGIRTRTRT